MPTPVAMPIGVIDENTGDGNIFSLLRPRDRDIIHPPASVIIYNEDTRAGAMARFRGCITEVGQHTASLIIEDSEISPNWPQHIDPRGAGNPVYLAQSPGSWLPDMNRLANSQREVEQLVEFAREHQENTGIPPAGTAVIMIPALPHPDDQGPRDLE